MISRRELVLIGFLALSLSLLAYTSVSYVLYQRPVSSTGAIKTIGVEVYKNAACTDPLTVIDWGFVENGTSPTYHFYVKNSGNFQSTLSMSVSASSWSPSVAANYITVSWNGDGILNAGSSVEVVMTLTIASNVNGLTNFSFTATITGTSTS